MKNGEAKSPWRADFPLLSRKFDGKHLIYLDSAATSLKPWPVIERVGHFLTYETANVHRGAHFLSNQATEFYEETRKTTAEFLGAAEPGEIIFTKGTTDSINLAAQVLATAGRIKEGDEILLTEMEHHSNIVPWQMVAGKVGAKIRVVPVTPKGELDLEVFENLLSPKTKVFSVVHCSNALGTINDLKDLTRRVHKIGGLVVGDGAQMVANRPVSVRDLDVDFYAFSAHKLFGPYGVGVLYGKKSLLDSLPPYQGGGSMISEVKWEKTTYHDVPYRFEAGTPNIEGVLGLKAAIDYLKRHSWDKIIEHEKALMRKAEEGVRTLDGLRIIGEAGDKGPILSFLMEGCHPSDVGQILDETRVAVRAGHHCAQPLMRALGIPATVRASFSIYNQESDVEALLQGLKKAKELLS